MSGRRATSVWQVNVLQNIATLRLTAMKNARERGMVKENKLVLKACEWLMLKACDKCAKMGARSCDCQMYPPHVNDDRAGYNPNAKIKPENPSDLDADKS